MPTGGNARPHDPQQPRHQRPLLVLCRHGPSVPTALSLFHTRSFQMYEKMSGKGASASETHLPLG